MSEAVGAEQDHGNSGYEVLDMVQTPHGDFSYDPDTPLRSAPPPPFASVSLVPAPPQPFFSGTVAPTSQGVRWGVAGGFALGILLGAAMGRRR